MCSLLSLQLAYKLAHGVLWVRLTYVAHERSVQAASAGSRMHSFQSLCVSGMGPTDALLFEATVHVGMRAFLSVIRVVFCSLGLVRLVG